MTVQILKGDCRDVLKTLPSESVHCVVTSPPYWGLRDYGTAKWEGGSPGCDHIEMSVGMSDSNTLGPNGYLPPTNAANVGRKLYFKAKCGKCGAQRIDSQIGLEPTFDAFIAEMVAVFREVRRILRKDGTLWLNLGDSYNAYNGGAGPSSALSRGAQTKERPQLESGFGLRDKALKPKDLCGIPWRVAFALQADGWWLRQDIIWAKPNPMPESVTDRCTKAHEYIFLLSKSARYYYDAEAIKEDALTIPYDATGNGAGLNGDRKDKGRSCNRIDQTNRNKRSVWEVATAPFSEAHFATFPPELIEPCIKAGCPSKVCSKCGVPLVRQVFVESRPNWQGEGQKHDGTYYRPNPGGGVGNDRRKRTVADLEPTCVCRGSVAVPGTVLDPFGGAGTTGLVADRLQRNAILIELNPQYAAMAEKRIFQDAPLFASVAAE